MTLAVEFSRYQSGTELVAAKAKLDRCRDLLPDWTNFLLIDDSEADANVLRAVLHSWLGHGISVSSVTTLGGALDHLNQNKPDILFLDHLLPPSDDAAVTIPYLRNIGYAGPIVIMSGKMSRALERRLVGAGAADMLHKDDFNSMSVAEVLLRVAGVSRQD